jgi:hypothetical protein
MAKRSSGGQVLSVKTKSSQVELSITNNEFFIMKRVTAQSKTGIFCDYGVAEAPLKVFHGSVMQS